MEGPRTNSICYRGAEEVLSHLDRTTGPAYCLNITEHTHNELIINDYFKKNIIILSIINLIIIIIIIL